MIKKLLPAVVFAVAGCTPIHESTDYLRHTNSRISSPIGGGDYFWFDVKLTPQMPLESEAAEQQRQLWLDAWVAQRGLCPNGHEVVERRPFDFLEHNPARLDLRYKVQCVVPAPVEEAPA